MTIKLPLTTIWIVLIILNLIHVISLSWWLVLLFPVWAIIAMISIYLGVLAFYLVGFFILAIMSALLGGKYHD